MVGKRKGKVSLTHKSYWISASWMHMKMVLCKMPNWIVRFNHTKSTDSLSYQKTLKCVVWANEFTDTLCIQTCIYYTQQKFHFYNQLVQNVKQININALMWHWDNEIAYKTQLIFLLPNKRSTTLQNVWLWFLFLVA